MKLFFTFTFYLVCLNSAFAKAAFSPNNIEAAVWKIRTPTIEESGFFVEGNLFATKSDHVLDLLNNENLLKNTVLIHEDDKRDLMGIKRIHSISLSDGTVILETKKAVEDFVNLENVSEPQGQLFVSGYLPGDSQITRKEGKNIFYENKQFYMFPYNSHSPLNTMNGGLVWDEQGRILGMAFASHSNTLMAIKQSRLNKIRNGELGLNCSNHVPLKCMEKALQKLEESADKGSPEAQFYLSKIYLQGYGVNQGFDRAFQLLKLAAEQEHLIAANNVAMMLVHGIGIEPNYDIASQLFEHVLEQGYFPAAFFLAKLQRVGLGTDPNPKKALELYEIAGNQGHVLARYEAANIYRKGLEIEANYEKALELYEQNRKQGHKPSHHNSAIMHLKGQGVAAKNPEKAFALFKQIEDYLPSKFVIASLHRYGQGTKKNPAKAFELFREIAEQNIIAQYHLGTMYINGEGTEVNKELGLIWIKRAAEEGYPEAMKYLKKLKKPKTT